MKTLRIDQLDELHNAQAVSGWVLDRIINREAFVLPLTASPEVQQVVIDTCHKATKFVSTADHMYWVNVVRVDEGIEFTPVRIDA